jgi:hypothetical protein
MTDDAQLEDDDVRILDKFSSVNSYFCRGVVERLTGDVSEFRFKLVRMLEQAWEILQQRFPDGDQDILRPDSAAAQFSFALVSLLATYEGRAGPLNAASFTSALVDVFGEGNTLRRIALLDGFVRGDERIRIDFRGLRVEDCLFRSVDVWNCHYDEHTLFAKCRFMHCSGTFSKASGILSADFQPDCQFDAEFERIYEAGNKKIQNTEGQNIESIRSFIADFYKQGGFQKKGKDNIERYYGFSNCSVPFGKIYKAMKKHNVIEEVDQGRWIDVRISNKASAAAEKFLTQGVLGGPLKAVALDLR